MFLQCSHVACPLQVPGGLTDRERITSTPTMALFTKVSRISYFPNFSTSCMVYALPINVAVPVVFLELRYLGVCIA
jgi:hypothetical protein